MGGDSVKQGAVKKQQRTYINNNNNAGQKSGAQAAAGLRGGKVSLIFLLKLYPMGR